MSNFMSKKCVYVFFFLCLELPLLVQPNSRLFKRNVSLQKTIFTLGEKQLLYFIIVQGKKYQPLSCSTFSNDNAKGTREELCKAGWSVQLFF